MQQLLPVLNKLLPDKSTYPLLKKYLSGTTASGIYEARLGKEMFGGETHVFSPAYTKKDLKELLQICDHIVISLDILILHS